MAEKISDIPFWTHYYRDKFARKVIPLVNLNSVDYNSGTQLSFNDVSNEHQWTYQQRKMNFNKDLNLKGLYCHHPFNTITVDGDANVFMCTCQAWLPISVGKIYDFASLEEIVKSPKAREIQRSIIDGSYRYCDHKTCSIINSKQLSSRIDHRPDNINWINFSLDFSCNLSCPSCRSEFKFLSDGDPEIDQKRQSAFYLAKLIENHNNPIKFTLAGDGDPFASIIYREFLSTLDLQEKSIQDVEIELITNGLLISSHWHKLKNIHKNIVRTKISFDAGTEEVYRVTRCGGDWSKLLRNVNYIKNWKTENSSNMCLTANFVVQTSNYKDMIEYVKICDQLGFDEINFQKIDNWGTFNNFNHHAVWMNSHPDYCDFLTYLNHPELSNSKVNLTNLSYLKNETS